jgi:antitoxin component of MazEF toxin-antitoxin module
MAQLFRTVLQGTEGSTATFVLVPATVMRAFGGRVRVPIVANINGIEHRTTICNMGTGPAIGIPAAMRSRANVSRGDRITVAISADKKERTVEVPRDLARALSAAERRVFDGLAYTHRKEYVAWIEGAKRPETRARRIEQARKKLHARKEVGAS